MEFELKVILNQLQLEEPIVVFSMPGMGKTVERKELVLNLLKQNLKKKIIHRDFLTKIEMERFLDEIQNLNENSIIVLGQCLNYGENASWFVDKLSQIIDKKTNVKIQTIIYTSPSSVIESIKSKSKLLSRVCNYRKPLNIADLVKLIGFYEQKYDLKVDSSLKEQIIVLSAGHIGLTKNLILETKINPKTTLDLETLLITESIEAWLIALIKDLDKECLEVLTKIRNDDEIVSILKKCGYFNEKGEIFSPLFQLYLKKNLEKKFSESSFENTFTDQEIKAYQLIKNSNGKIVTREQIAKSIWGDEWLEKYSDWAIDQLIHSIREKMLNSQSTNKITTLRGKGYKFNVSY